ncbi:hypothetical protein Leryth_004494 [Lithospermum erythrorhizon]|uniref:DNA-binding transcription factor n=1 Tax=Lithospermum erythrorhizon TaxID=34254 RepID=A0AAV3RK50_LITER|nr:hypothetical protein Leryth_004494 [Lithospermum erythrorhizon]
MSHSNEAASSNNTSQKKFRGVRRRKWGKYVSEIRVPGTQERLWLGTYATAEAAAVAHDVAFYCLRETSSYGDFNFPDKLPPGIQKSMSPRSVQRTATDAGLAIDAQIISQPKDDDHTVELCDQSGGGEGLSWQCCDGYSSGGSSWEGAELNISVDDYI